MHAYTFEPDARLKPRTPASNLVSFIMRHWIPLVVIMVSLGGIAGFIFGGREKSKVEPVTVMADGPSYPVKGRLSGAAEQEDEQSKDETEIARIFPDKTPIVGEDLPKAPGAARIVKMFDIFCLSLVPELSKIAKTATARNFTELKGKWLEKHQPQVRAEELRAWTYKDFGLDYTLTTSRSKPDAQFKNQFPKFANSENFACSLIVPSEEAVDYFFAEVVRFVGRDPDAESSDQKEQHISAWREMADDNLVIIEYQHPRPGQIAILRAMAFVKN